MKTLPYCRLGFFVRPRTPSTRRLDNLFAFGFFRPRTCPCAPRVARGPASAISSRAARRQCCTLPTSTSLPGAWHARSASGTNVVLVHAPGRKKTLASTVLAIANISVEMYTPLSWRTYQAHAVAKYRCAATCRSKTHPQNE